MFDKCREQSEQELVEEIHRADVICIIYDVNDDDTLTKVCIRALCNCLVGLIHLLVVVVYTCARWMDKTVFSRGVDRPVYT